MSTATRAFPRARRGTYTFLRDARNTCHVYLMVDVDATRMKEARRSSGGKLSYVSLVVKAAGDAVAASVPARTVLSDGLWPSVTVVDDVHAKVLFDKTVDGERCVVSGIVPSVPECSVLEVQDEIDTYKDAAVGPDGPFTAVWRMQRLPLPVSRLAYALAVRDPRRRARLQGVFSVTSVGHTPVRAIFPMITGTLGFGMGRIADKAAVREGRVEPAPSFTLSLAFDHRVLDGALASELLAQVKDTLERWEMP